MKTSRREFSFPESEAGKKGSKLGASAEIGRYHIGIGQNRDVFLNFFKTKVYFVFSLESPH